MTNMARRRKPDVDDLVARLREEWMEVIKEGLGRDSLSLDEMSDERQELQDSLSEVFMLYAKVQLAEQLGIIPWLKADLTGQFPNPPDFPGQDGVD